MKINLFSLFILVSVLNSACSQNSNSESAQRKNEIKADTTEFYAFIKEFRSDDTLVIVILDKITITEAIDSIEDGSAIINSDEDTNESYSLSSEAEITMQTYSHDSSGRFNFNEKIPAENFIKFFEQTESERFRFTPFVIKAINDKIISIKEKYLP